MKKLLLTSTGLSSDGVRKKFLELLGNPIDLSKINVLFIPTASRTQDELKYVKESKNELLEIGIPVTNITEFSPDKEAYNSQSNRYDVVYVCGGNTFYLLKVLKETHFDRALISMVEDGCLYFGVSAGSIIAGPSIEIASPFDDNDVKLGNLESLSIVSFATSPHYIPEEEPIISEIKQRVKYEIIPLNDTQAISIVQDKTEIIN